MKIKWILKVTIGIGMRIIFFLILDLRSWFHSIAKVYYDIMIFNNLVIMIGRIRRF